MGFQESLHKLMVAKFRVGIACCEGDGWMMCISEKKLLASCKIAPVYTKTGWFLKPILHLQEP